jgi:hypothetical protein
MIWGKRRFQWAEYAKYQDLLAELQQANAARYREFMMFAVERSVGDQDIYVGVPTKELMAAFDSFEPVSEAALPKTVDGLLLADVNAFEEAGFEFRKDKTAR